MTTSTHGSTSPESEAEITARLMDAAQESGEQHLSVAEVDLLLGVRPAAG